MRKSSKKKLTKPTTSHSKTVGSFKAPARLVQPALAVSSDDPIVGPVVRMPDGTTRTAYHRAAEQAAHYVATLVCVHVPAVGRERTATTYYADRLTEFSKIMQWEWPCESCLALAAEQIGAIVDVLKGATSGQKEKRSGRRSS